MAENTSKTIEELIAICLAPSLEQSIDDRQILPEDYEEFKSNCSKHLPLLFDVLSEGITGEIFNFKDDNEDHLPLKVSLFRLICEQTFQFKHIENPFKVNNRETISVLNEFYDKILKNEEDKLFDKSFENYKSLLLSGKWKTELGASYGFLQFCEICLTRSEKFNKSEKVYFILSIATQFLENFSPDFKALGLQLFQIIVLRFDKTMLIGANIHKVIFKACLDNSRKMLNETCQILLWDTLVKSLTMDDGILKCEKWNELDDCLQVLFQKIKMESKAGIRDYLKLVLTFLIKTSSPFKNDLMNKSDKILALQNQVLVSEQRNVAFFRWIRDLCELFIFECLSTSNSRQRSTLDTINFIHLSYVLVIFGVDLNLVGTQIDNLIKRMLPLLLEIMNIYKDELDVRGKIMDFLETIDWHVDAYVEGEEKSNYQQALSAFLKSKDRSTDIRKKASIKMRKFI